MRQIRIRSLFALFLIFLTNSILHAAVNKNWIAEKDKAEVLFNQGKYDESIILFREIILSSENDDLERESYFWIAKAYIAVDKLDQAQANLEYYLQQYEDNGLNYPEAVYQKGRLLFLQEQYQPSIEQLHYFISEFPKHDLISNAYYWIAESLYALGQFDDAILYCNIVLEKYPRSVKVEAVRYKLRLIEHKKSELALQNLVKWSQEQYLSILSQFKVKERTLQQAIEEYENSRGSVADPEMKEKYNRLQKENEALTQKILLLENQLTQLEQSIGDKDLEQQLQQLRFKEQLLLQKEEALKILEMELRKKEAALEK